VWKIYEEKALKGKPVEQMTLEDKGLLLQLKIGDAFGDGDLPQPSSSMSPEDKGALLLAYIKRRLPLYRSEVNENAKAGERWLCELPLDFSGINLRVLGLMGADLAKADFSAANASDANLLDVNLDGASLQGANIEGCHLGGATLTCCNLKGYSGFPYNIKGCVLDSETYRLSDWTPETLGIWHQAGARILALDEFPRDAIELIVGEYSKGLKPQVFLSYGGCDSNVAMHIATHLEARGLKVWFAGWDIDYGDDIVKKIEEGLEATNTFVIVLSPEALERPWVRQELSSAFFQALSGQEKQIIPVMHKPCKPPAFLGSRKWLDFQVPYHDPLERLVRAIRGKSIHRGWDWEQPKQDL
jgi:hypothetical protein